MRFWFLLLKSLHHRDREIAPRAILDQLLQFHWEGDHPPDLSWITTPLPARELRSVLELHLPEYRNDDDWSAINVSDNDLPGFLREADRILSQRDPLYRNLAPLRPLPEPFPNGAASYTGLCNPFSINQCLQQPYSKDAAAAFELLGAIAGETRDGQPVIRQIAMDLTRTNRKGLLRNYSTALQIRLEEIGRSGFPGPEEEKAIAEKTAEAGVSFQWPESIAIQAAPLEGEKPWDYTIRETEAAILQAGFLFLYGLDPWRQEPQETRCEIQRSDSENAIISVNFRPGKSLRLEFLNPQQAGRASIREQKADRKTPTKIPIVIWVILLVALLAIVAGFVII